MTSYDIKILLSCFFSIYLLCVLHYFLVIFVVISNKMYMYLCKSLFWIYFLTNFLRPTLALIS